MELYRAFYQTYITGCKIRSKSADAILIPRVQLILQKQFFSVIHLLLCFFECETFTLCWIAFLIAINNSTTSSILIQVVLTKLIQNQKKIKADNVEHGFILIYFQFSFSLLFASNLSISTFNSNQTGEVVCCEQCITQKFARQFFKVSSNRF